MEEETCWQSVQASHSPGHGGSIGTKYQELGLLYLLVWIIIREVIGIRIKLSRSKMRIRWDILGYVLLFSIGTIGLILRPSSLKVIILVYSAMGIVGTIGTLLVHLLDKGEPSIVFLDNKKIKFGGPKTPNKEFKLSEYDRIYYKKGLMSSYFKLERDEGERPNWYKAFGRPKEEDKEKLERLIKIANERMKDKR